MRKMAIMKGVCFGMRDCNKPVLFFSTYISEGSAALQVLDVISACKLISDYGVYDIKNLEGKACWVNADDSTITYLEACKI
jgi:hypothetical protein